MSTLDELNKKIHDGDWAEATQAYLEFIRQEKVELPYNAAYLLREALAQVKSLTRERDALLNFIDSHGIDRDEVDEFMIGNGVREAAER